MSTCVLLVEDEATLSLLASITLEDEGYEVLTATNGEKGLVLAHEKHPDLIIADYMMPVMDGLAMIRALRDEGIATPVLMTTAVPQRQLPDGEAKFKTLYSAFLSKPYTEQDLVQKVRELLSARPVGAPSASTS